MSLPPHDKQRRSDMLAMRRKDGCLIRQMFRGRDIGRYLQKYEITLKYGLFVGGFFNLIFLIPLFSGVGRRKDGDEQIKKRACHVVWHALD